MYSIGQFVGGAIGVLLLSLFWEWALYRRVMDDSVKGGLASVATAYVTAVVLYGFGAADGGPWTPAGIVNYLPGAIVIGGLTYWKRSRDRDREFL